MSSLRNDKRGSSYLISAPEGGSVEFAEQHSQGAGAYYMETYLKKKRVYWVKFSAYITSQGSLLFIAALTTFILPISFKYGSVIPQKELCCAAGKIAKWKVSSNKKRHQYQLRTFSTRIRCILINAVLTYSPLQKLTVFLVLGPGIILTPYMKLWSNK